jgi:hypothetical protein
MTYLNFPASTIVNTHLQHLACRMHHSTSSLFKPFTTLTCHFGETALAFMAFYVQVLV